MYTVTVTYAAGAFKRPFVSTTAAPWLCNYLLNLGLVGLLAALCSTQAGAFLMSLRLYSAGLCC